MRGCGRQRRRAALGGGSRSPGRGHRRTTILHALSDTRGADPECHPERNQRAVGLSDPHTNSTLRVPHTHGYRLAQWHGHGHGLADGLGDATAERNVDHQADGVIDSTREFPHANGYRLAQRHGVSAAERECHALAKREEDTHAVAYRIGHCPGELYSYG